MDKQSCFYCKNAIIDGGYSGSYDEPGYAAFVEDCNCKEVSADLLESIFEQDEAELLLPEKCGHYDPHIMEVCGECKKPMGIPVHEVEYYVTGMWDAIPCCSKECQDAGNKKFGDEMREMAESQINFTR